jgi:hypothetical protein
MIARSLLLAASLVFTASAAAAPGGLAPYHEPPWLVSRGTSPTIAYALLPSTATGTLYVRDDLRRGYRRIALRPGTYCPGDPADAAAMRRDKVCGAGLLARVPASLTSGSKLYYHAVIRDHGRSVTTPTQRIWTVRRFDQINLGRQQFGRFTTPDAVVARTGPKGVGLTCCADPPGGDGPSSLDIGSDGSIWVLDRLNHRLLVWKGGTSAPARSVALPSNLAVTDFALGRRGTIYVRAVDTSQLGHGTKNAVYALNSSGTVLWKTPVPYGIATAQLQVGPDGALYAMQACACPPFGGNLTWTALTTASGKPLSRSMRKPTPFEPLPGGLRLVAETSFTVARFALIDAADRIVRAWTVRSTTRLSALAASPALVGHDPIVVFEVSNGPKWQKLVVGLESGVRLALDDRPIVGEVNLFAPLRLTSDGHLYELRTSLGAGASVARYELNR